MFPPYSQHFTTPLVPLHDRREYLVALQDTLHESTPQTTAKNTAKKKLKRESSRKSSKNQRLFPTANLVLRSALGTCSKFAVKNNFLSLCAWRSHCRAVLLQTLRWLSEFSKKICRGCRKKQVGVLKRWVFRQCHFPIRHHEWFLLRSCSDFHNGNRYDYVANVANFCEHSSGCHSLILGCNNGGGGENFWKVKRLAAKWIGTHT